MNYEHCCVIDAAGNYKTLVLVTQEPDEEGQIQNVIHSYKLLPGEQLIGAMPPPYRPYAGASGFVKPRWDGSAWAEDATPEQIAAWEAEHPAPPPDPPSISEINTMAIAELSMAQAQQSAESNQAIAELSILLAGGMSNV